jgi:glycerate dehydrogenase
MKGVFLDLDTMAPADLDLAGLEGVLPEMRFYDRTAPEEVAERLRGVEVAVVQKVVLTGDLLKQADALRMICVAAAGTNNVDIKAAAELGIPVSNVRGYASDTVSQHVFALILALATSLCDYHDAVRGGRWQQSANFCFLDYPIRELSGMTLGIVGYGNLGQAVARIAEAFGMRVLVSQRIGGEPQPGRVSLDELLERSDVVTLHCPLTEQTRNLIGREQLARMKNDALLINTARGGLVDEVALVEALHNGVIGGAGFDVLTTEPPVNGNPLLADDIPNLIVTPHVAWGSREARQRVIDECVLNIRAFLAGEARNPVLP